MSNFAMSSRLCVFAILLLGCASFAASFSEKSNGSLDSNKSSVHYDVFYTLNAPVIDGKDDDVAWIGAAWHPLDTLIIGSMLDPNDFSGRFKIVWTSERIYLLAEIIDDVLIDSHANPLESYWDDDALEIFIDEDGSGGDHQFNYNAFAYHIALDNQAADIGPFRDLSDEKSGKAFVRLFPNHIISRWQRSFDEPNKIIWEVGMAIFDDTFVDNSSKPVVLKSGKEMGFMLSYCDADSIDGREHFISSQDIPVVNGNKNRGYIDASVFGLLTLKTK